MLDLPGLETLLHGLHTREISLVDVETPTVSPFASSLLFDYVATYMYEGDTPNAERRAAALSLDRDLLRELLGQEELRELIDPGALERVEDDLQHRSELTRATSRDGLHDVLRHVGDLAREEVSVARVRRRRCSPRCSPSSSANGVPSGCAWAVRSATSRPTRPASIATRSPPRPRAGCRRRSSRMCPTRCGSWWRATHAPTGRSPPRSSASATAWTRARSCASSSARESSSAASFAPVAAGASGATSRFCAASAAPRWRPCARRSSRPSSAVSRPSCPPGRASTATPRAAPGSTGCARCSCGLQGLALPVEIWERDVLPRRTGAYSQSWLDSLCASGELVWVGAGPLGGRSGRVALYFRDDAPSLGPPSWAARRARGGSPPDRPEHELLRGRLSQGPCFFTDLLAELDVPGGGAPRGAVGSRVGRRGDQRRLGAAARASSRARPGRSLTRSPHGPAPCAPGHPRAVVRRRAVALRRAPGRATQVAGWASSCRDAGRSPRRSSAAAADDPSERRRALCELLLERYGIVTREQVLAEGIRGGFATLYSDVLATSRRSACAVVATSSRAWGERSSRCPARSSACAPRAGSPAGARGASALVIAAADPAQPYGAALPWPKREGLEPAPGARRGRLRGARRRRAGPVRGARRPRSGHARRRSARRGGRCEALAEAVRSGRVGKLALERIDGEPAMASELVGSARASSASTRAPAAHADRLRRRSDAPAPERCPS